MLDTNFNWAGGFVDVLDFFYLFGHVYYRYLDDKHNKQFKTNGRLLSMFNIPSMYT